MFVPFFPQADVERTDDLNDAGRLAAINAANDGAWTAAATKVRAATLVAIKAIAKRHGSRRQCERDT